MWSGERRREKVERAGGEHLCASAGSECAGKVAHEEGRHLEEAIAAAAAGDRMRAVWFAELAVAGSRAAVRRASDWD